MARVAHQSEVEPLLRERTASDDLIFELAQAQDETSLHQLLRSSPMPGWITLSFEREPDYFLATTIEGDTHQTMVARERETGRVVGMFTRSVQDAFLNGDVRRMGYLGQLRVDPAYRGSVRRLRQGYEACRQLLHRDGQTPFYLTSIIESNERARRVLTAGLPGLPTYHEFEIFATLALPCRHARPARSPAGLVITQGDSGRYHDLAECLQRNYAHYQCAPLWTTDTLRSSERCRGLKAHDFFLAYLGERLVGCLALWDQNGFKQTVVRDYAPWLARWRPLTNLAAPVLGLPNLPPPGASLRLAYLSHVAADNDDPDVLISLIEAGLREATYRGYEYVMVGFASSNPVLRLVKRRFRCVEYRSVLYLVYWSDGAHTAHALDDRPVHVEVATL